MSGRVLRLNITVSRPSLSSHHGRHAKGRMYHLNWNNKYLKKCEDKGACLSPLPFE